MCYMLNQHADGLLPAPVFVENSFANLSSGESL